MRDEGLTTAPTLSPAEAAVSYLLKRMKVDANLRYHMLHTEAFARLCAAEAQRTGKTAEQIEDLYSEMAEHCCEDEPRLIEVQRAVRKAVRALKDMPRSPRLDQAIDELERVT